MKTFPLIAGALLLSACSADKVADPNCDPIRINQVGYFINQSKTASIEAEGLDETYQLLDASGNKVWEGAASRLNKSPWCDKERAIVNFSSVNTPGKYTLVAGPYTKEVSIAEHPMRDLAIAAIKAFYYQRTGVELPEQYAGKWNRPAAHPDTNVMVHPSAASKDRPEGTIISSPAGWYDAGDFNKYIVNSGFTIGEMLTVYQLCPEYFGSLNLNIPESGDATPDVLDEIMFNLKWMLTMQDPADGGVYHKLTTPNFENFVMPAECSQQRYVVQKGTAATLDFVATMAMASRIYGQYEAYADFAKEAKEAAIKAWKWAKSHPSVIYSQSAINEKYEPKVNTGEYGDGEFKDEFFWAASELYFTTGQRPYLNAAASYAPKEYTLPTWGNVNGLGILAWLVQSTYGFSEDADILGNRYTNKVLAYCDNLLAKVEGSCYDSPYGNSPEDFGWGCLAESGCGQGLSMLFAYRMTSDQKYLQGAIQCADYLLGRNATGYCYVTGFGSKPSMNPHQRISFADGIEDPLPGFLVGGPNAGQQDGLTTYPSKYPDESYLDDKDSYASNEIAINWNAGLFAFIGWLDAVVK